MKMLIAAALAALLAGAVQAQEGDPPQLSDLIGKAVRVETVGGGSFQGLLFSVGPDRLEIIEPDGQIIQVSLEAVKNALEIPPGKGVRAFYQDSAANRLIVAPTGFAMETGELHVTDQEAVIITGSYGLNRYMSFWAGISPVGALLSARATVSLGRFAVSAGSFAGLAWVEALGAPLSGLLLPYALASWGEPNNNVTLGGAFAFGFGAPEPFRSIGAVFELGGKLVLTSTTALVTENWVIWSKVDGEWDPVPMMAILGLVFRIAGSRLSWDIGALLPLQVRGGIGGMGDGPVIPIPYVSVTYRIR